MKTKSITKVTLLAIFVMSVITAVTLNSCQKEIVKPKALNNTQKATNVDPMAASADLIEQITGMVFQSHKNTKGLMPNISAFDSSACTAITIDSTVKPYSATYSYGSGCVGMDGKTRSGTAIISCDANDIRVVNNVYTVTLQNYSIGTKITNANGQLTFTNTGPNGNGNLVLVLAGYYVMTVQSYTDTIRINYSYEWIAGESSNPLSDVQFNITGSATGSFSNGAIASTTITSPLTKNSATPGCNYIIGGSTYIVSPDTTQNMSINYSVPGGCSGQMAVTQGGLTKIENQY